VKPFEFNSRIISMKKWFKLSGLLWGLILVVPWLGFSKKEIAGIMAILIIAGEITFYLGILILGKSIYVKIKNNLMFWKKKTEDGSRKTEEIVSGKEFRED
jgi:hypothetical protein